MSTIVKSKILHLVLGLFFAVFYMLIQSLFLYTINITNIYVYFILAVEIPVCAIYIVLYFQKNNYSFSDFINIIIFVSLIQSAIAIIAFVNKDIHNSLVNMMVDNGMPEVYLVLTSRIFGLARGLTSTMPIIHSIISLICFYLGITKSGKYFVFIPFLLFSAIINARIAAVVFLIGLIVVFHHLKIISFAEIKKMIFVIFLIILGVAFSPFLFEKYSPSTLAWLNEGFLEIKYLLQGEKIGTYEFLFSDTFLTLPRGFLIFFCTGFNVFGLANGSDIGYVNDLWLGGIFFCIIIYSALVSFIATLYSNNETIYKCIASLLLVTFIIFNVKGIAIANNELTAFAILIIIFMNTQDKKAEKLLEINQTIYKTSSTTSYLKNQNKPSKYLKARKSAYIKKY